MITCKFDENRNGIYFGVIMKKNDNIRVFERDNYYLLFNKKTKKSFTLGKKEYEFWDSLDGSDFNKFDSPYSNSEKKELMSIFEEAGLLQNSEGHLKLQGKYKKALLCPEFFLDRHKLLIQSYWWLMIIGLVAVIPAIFLCDFEDINNIIIKYANVETGMVGVVFVIIALSFHELSHALIAKKNGAVVPEIGIMINFVLPCAYTTVCDSRNISTCRKKITVALAGMGGNILLITVGLYLYLFSKDESLRFLCIEFVFANIIPIVGNINIFYRDDSYVIIESLLGVRDLKQSAKDYLIAVLKNMKYKNSDGVDYLTSLILIIYAVGAYINELLFPFIIIFLLISTYVKI